MMSKDICVFVLLRKTQHIFFSRVSLMSCQRRSERRKYLLHKCFLLSLRSNKTRSADVFRHHLMSYNVFNHKTTTPFLGKIQGK